MMDCEHELDPLFEDEHSYCSICGALVAKQSKDEQVADRMIATLRKYGYSYDEMIPVFRLAGKKYKAMKKEKLKTDEKTRP